MTPGTRIGPYDIVALIGAGGMGEVYRARDTKLKREVALKVLPEAFAGDPERMARFQREAEVLASLNHPNIAHIYGVEDRALVMELVEGDSPQGPLPLDEAWKVAAQIADALDYAHERGIVHRDLKPANVKLTADGVVKLLDFGLAKAFTGPAAVPVNPENSPTLTLGATQLGVILGTAAYMAPEQAKGKTVDKRADIWSFGVVLYELITGEKLFQREDVSDTLAQVLTKEPDFNRVPAQARKLLRRCLEKDPKQRLRDIGEARHLLEESAAPVRSPSSPSRIAWAVAAALFVVSMALGSAAWKHVHEAPPEVVKFSFPPPEKGIFPQALPTMTVSPDGRHVAFQAIVDSKWELWVRDLDNSSPRMLAATENRPELPFWAPDSRRLGFFDGDQLKKVDITGGPAVPLASTGSSGLSSGSWNRQDVIVFGSIGTPVFRVSAAGGRPSPVTMLDRSRGEDSHWAPWFLPDGRHFLYVAFTGDSTKGAVYAGDLDSKARKQVLGFGTRVIYVSPGYLLYLRDQTLMAQPFDANKLETTGDAVPLAEPVDFNEMGALLGHFSASDSGVLMYTSGAGSDVQLTWFDHAGKRLDTASEPGDLESFSISPDGRSVAYARGEPQTGRYDIWIRNLDHGSDSRLTFTAINRAPVWSHDGVYIYFRSNRDGKCRIYRKAANSTGSEEMVSALCADPSDASRDGRYLIAYSPLTTGVRTSNDIWVLPLFGDHKPFSHVATEFNEVWPRLSPDGRWLAYMSNESRRPEIYVVGFPELGEKWPISTGGGTSPVWSRDGRELYYYSADGRIMAAEIKPGKEFNFDTPRPLFPAHISGKNVSFDVSGDGRFLLPLITREVSATPMNVVLNWPQMLKRNR